MLVLGVAAVASAIPYTDTYDAGHYYMDEYGSNSEVLWIFDITEYGFDPVTQDVTSAEVELIFEDEDSDTGQHAQIERASLVVGLINGEIENVI
jgi:hypothetical protein